MGNPIFPVAGDQPPDVPPVTTPDEKARGKSSGQGFVDSGIVGHIFAVGAACAGELVKVVMTVIAGVFDEILSIIVPVLTASQGEQTKGFYDLVAGLLNDLLGVEVSGDDLSNAQDSRGRIGAMQQVGGDFLQTLVNEFVGLQPDAGEGAGIGGLPGAPGQPVTPEQGVKAAKAFVGFLMSFAVRQGNVAVLTDALSVHLLGQIREYGEMMAKNLGLSRMARRALQPFIQTLIATPLQQALNQQYRPHVMDAKQLASAYIRSDIDRSDYVKRLSLLGFSDGDIDLLIRDTYTRLKLEDVFILHENGIFTDEDLNSRVSSLGFNTSDTPLLLQAKVFGSIAGVQRDYVKTAIRDFEDGVISQATFETDVDSTNLPREEKRWYKILAENRAGHKRAHLSLGFLKRAYLNATITIDEYLAHAASMGFSQDDIDILEVELLFEQKQTVAHAAAKAAALAKRLAGKTPSTPPTP